MKTKTLSLEFGALCDPIAFQIDGQGLKLSDAEREFSQKAADSITLLTIKGLLTRPEAEKARKRLLARVAAYAEPV